EGGPGVGCSFACPGGVASSPGSFFACPGGVFAGPAAVTDAGGWRLAAPGCAGGGDGFTDATGGAGEETGVCFARPALTAGWGCTATGVTETTGVATVPDCSEVGRCGLWCVGFWMVGACTTLGLGPRPSAVPRGAAGVASSRGINAPPPIATTSKSPAITRSLRLMFLPPSADNFREGSIGRRECSLDMEGV